MCYCLYVYGMLMRFLIRCKFLVCLKAVGLFHMVMHTHPFMQVELPGCKGIWTVYHKNARGHNADFSKMAADENEYHAYLIISLEARTMVISFALY